jgi:hypothetical protein
MVILEPVVRVAPDSASTKSGYTFYLPIDKLKVPSPVEGLKAFSRFKYAKIWEREEMALSLPAVSSSNSSKGHFDAKKAYRLIIVSPFFLL